MSLSDWFPGDGRRYLYLSMISGRRQPTGHYGGNDGARRVNRAADHPHTAAPRIVIKPRRDSVVRSAVHRR